MPENDRPFTALDAYFRSSVETNPEYDERCLAMIRLGLARAMTNDKVPVFVDMGPGNGMVDHQCADVVPESCGAALLEVDDQQKVSHVVDWIVSSVRADSPWISRTDRDGRPLKLLKIGSLDRAVAEADKAMRRFAAENKKKVLVDGDEVVHAELGGGWRLVRLMTPESLDRESGLMQHCIGQGGYDRKVVEGSEIYLSLRDPSGNPHATLEIRNRDLLQFQGKQNEHPIERYIAVVRPWLKENIEVDPRMGNGHIWWSNRVIDTDGIFHEMDALPDSLIVHRTLQLHPGPGRPLPSSELCVLDKGWVGLAGAGPFTMPMRSCVSALEVRGGHATFPPGSRVQATHLVLKDCRVDGFKHTRTELSNLNIVNAQIDGIPSGIDLKLLSIVSAAGVELPPQGSIEELVLHSAGSIEIPKDLKIKKLEVQDTTILLPGQFECGDLEIDDGRVEGLTCDTKVTGRLMIGGTAPSVVLPDGIELGELVVNNWPGGQLPRTLKANRSMDLRGYGGELPENLTVDGSLTVNGRYIHHLPAGLDVSGDLFYIVDRGVPTISPGTRIGGRVIIAWNDGVLERYDPWEPWELTIVETPEMTL